MFIDLECWLTDLKINRDRSLLITNLHMKYHYNLMKGSHDTEQISCGLPTDIPTDRGKAVRPSSSKADI
jgi:hypothetical protein